MAKTLVVVESPSKAKTISRYLGKNFIVESSYGHIRDLPKSQLGVDTENNFAPHYIIPRKSLPRLKKLREDAAGVENIILATDEDREGEAIAWHLEQALSEIKKNKKKISKKEEKPKHFERIVFHEITENAIKKALENPREIIMPLVDAQQARRILDRLVGYKLSPFLWKKVYRGLSAGRVQSVAVRIIVEREREIQKFVPEEYWTIEASLNKKDSKLPIQAVLAKVGGSTLDKFSIKKEDGAKEITAKLENAAWQVLSAEKKAVSKNPLPPFTTSTLQQEAFRKLGFSAKQTMMIAQQLYEGTELGSVSSGLITYMRTDSLSLSEEAIQGARTFLENSFGKNYVNSEPRRFKTKSKGAQEAHEAIRATDPTRTPESIKNYLDKRQFKLYDLIWRRFIATQMPPAIFEAINAEIIASSQKNPEKFIFKANGQTLSFEGFLKIYPSKFSEVELPPLAPKDSLTLEKLSPLQHFTEPPARFTEASLVKALEQNGIGRPSTYAPTISTIQDRGYVKKDEKRRLSPTDTGFLVNDLLVEHFPQIVEIEFTVKMEDQLDEIAEGKIKWQPVIKEFYDPFAKRLEEKYEEVKKHEVSETTDELCNLCGKPMIVKLGRFGKFLACSGFPECKNTKAIKQEPQLTGMKCPKCSTGDIIIKKTRRGKIFYGCSRYPDCDYASWNDPRKKEEEKETPA